MDSDKKKPLPEKFPSFNDNQPDHHDLDIDKDRNTTDPPLSETSAEVEEAQPDNAETNNKEEEDQINTEIEDSSFPETPDFSQVSAEIDQFISILSNLKSDEFELPEIPEFVEQFALLVEAKIANYDSTDPPLKWSQVTEEESTTFLEAVNRIFKLSTSLCAFSSESKYDSSINRVGGILQRAMSYLEEEFRSLLEDYKLPNSDHNNDSKMKQSSSSLSNQDSDQCALPEKSDSTTENNFPGYSEEVVSNLNKLVITMMVGGYETECRQVYFISRRNALEESLHELGFEKHSIDDVQKMNWESLEREIVSWIKTFKQCSSMQFTGERKLAEAVFSGYESVSETLFSNLSRGVMIQLLNFAEAVAMTKRAAEKLFKFLDIYEALRDIIPVMDELFPADCSEKLKAEASLTRSRLGEAMVCIFCELENSIKSDTGKTPVPGGAVHPLTRYIMNYLKYACEYKDTLEQVFREHQKIERADSASRSNYDYNSQSQNINNPSEKQSPLESQITKVMDLLDTNLDSKSKLYKDTSLSLIFMMNNGRYILQKIKGSTEINSLLGDPWCRKRSSELRQYHKSYQRETWGKLLSCLTHEGLNVHGKVVKPVLKERFKSFNAMFDEIHKSQSTWVVSDEQLQSELRVSISAVVIPAYRSFMARFSQYLTPGRQSEKYIKYQPEDIETYVDELFDGNATPTGKKKP
ncbi:unnamed protein product [Ilex paraguariensis]|uniref:Exocyst subunit Exo70 family protein n=1 Tax=Ilex paraguariensis TaxID=185542 RepID=A0ABC8SWY3_9AQUA